MASRSLLYVTLLLAVLLCPVILADEKIIDTDNGKVEGIVGSNYRAFLGIPFIAPPVGNLRFAPPAPAKAWAPAVYNATRYKSGCPQICELPPNTCPESYSEDCIYLNVYTPRASQLSEPQPVYVYLPGGHFEQGSAGVSLYDASNFVSRSGVLMVTVSYRLGALGWVTAESKGISGNYGFLDQRAALQWVQKNIAAFGGDPNNVILTGQSAGATSTAAHLASPGSKGLFHKVVIQSDPITLHMRSSKDASILGDKFMKILGCGDRDCLLNKTTDEIVKAQHAAADGGLSWSSPLTSFLPWTPTVDKKEISQATWEAVKSGNYHKVPIIMGTLAEEALLFVYKGMNKTLDELLYAATLVKVFRMQSFKISKLYPGNSSPTGDRREIMSVLGTDYIFQGINRNILTQIKNHNPDLGVYTYIVNHPLSFDAWGPEYQYCVGHSCHGGEIPLIFQAPGAVALMTKEELQLSNQIIDYWANFARTGNPNKGLATVNEWPEINSDNYPYMEFKTPLGEANTNYRKNYLDFFDSIGYHWGWSDKGLKSNN